MPQLAATTPDRAEFAELTEQFRELLAHCYLLLGFVQPQFVLVKGRSARGTPPPGGGSAMSSGCRTGLSRYQAEGEMQ